jgi:hypothetical protein
MAEKNESKALKRWCLTRGVSSRSLDLEVGGGGQVSKFTAGTRPLPLPLAARVSTHTGIPISKLLNSDQMAQARVIFSAVARAL